MGATFNRVKNWTTEVLTNSDLNAEIDNILNNLGPAGVDDYSATATQMKLQTSPGTLGSESLATSLAGELERLRYVIQRVIGSDVDYWYEAPPTSLSDLVASQGSGIPVNRISSGLTTGNSSQLIALRPSGTTASLTLSASTTPFVYYIGGQQYSITANITLTGLSLASGTNNTCSFNALAASGQQWTKIVGQYGTSIPVDGMDSGISSLVGKIAGFQTGNEYFLANVQSTLSLTNAYRGYFFNSTPTLVEAVGLSDNAEIKLLKLAWIFANTNSSLAVTYTNPTVSADQPTSPNTGDYWFDLSSTAWKTYNSTNWVAANATLIGMSLQDTAACVAARTFESHVARSELNTLKLSVASNTVVQASELFGEVSVFGQTSKFQFSRPTWDITTDLESGVTESANTTYYCYLKENGDTVLSNKIPAYRRDLGGLYHPGETWRCLGSAINNNSTNFESYARSFLPTFSEKQLIGDLLAYSPLISQGNIQYAFPNYIVEASNVTATAGTAWSTIAGDNTWGDLATIALTQGVWRVQGWVNWLAQGAVTGSLVRLWLSSTQGNVTVTSSTFGYGQDVMAGYINTNGAYLSLFTPSMMLNITASTNWYLKGMAFVSEANLKVVGAKVQAVRFDNLNGMPL